MLEVVVFGEIVRKRFILAAILFFVYLKVFQCSVCEEFIFILTRKSTELSVLMRACGVGGGGGAVFIICNV